MTSDDIVTHASHLLDLPNFEDGEKKQALVHRIKAPSRFWWDLYTTRFGEQGPEQLETVESSVDATFLVDREISVRLDSFSRYWVNR
jgi:hypothetical protein